MIGMCGRYATTRGAADLAALFDAVDETGDGLSPDYNVAPTDPVPVVRRSRRLERPVLSVARWGLLPSWAGARSPAGAASRGPGAPLMINARAETVATGRAFAPSFARRRCLVPADGWYEWLRRPGGKQAYFITGRDGAVLAFAGLWTVCDGPAGPVLSCSIVTTAAIGELTLVHRRMPLVLARERWSGWLDGDAEAVSDPGRLLAPPPPRLLSGLEIRPVGSAVGDVRNDGPDLVRPVPAAPLHAPADDPVDLTLF
jgi:putative SOS response-associated peptidase YedK